MRRRRQSALGRRYGRQRGREPGARVVREMIDAQNAITRPVRAIPMQEMVARDRREREQQERDRR